MYCRDLLRSRRYRPSGQPPGGTKEVSRPPFSRRWSSRRDVPFLLGTPAGARLLSATSEHSACVPAGFGARTPGIPRFVGSRLGGRAARPDASDCGSLRASGDDRSSRGRHQGEVGSLLAEKVAWRAHRCDLPSRTRLLGRRRSLPAKNPTMAPTRTQYRLACWSLSSLVSFAIMKRLSWTLWPVAFEGRVRRLGAC